MLMLVVIVGYHLVLVDQVGHPRTSIPGLLAICHPLATTTPTDSLQGIL